MKQCSKCCETKDIDEFSKYSRNTTTGLRADCKKCQSKQTVIDTENRRSKRLNQQKFDQMHRGMSAQAKKVYEAIPIAESWTPTQIMQELHRKNISMRDVNVVMGCLNSLIDCNLVVEPVKGVFRREPIRPKCESQDTQPIEQAKEKEVNKTVIAPVSPIDLLGAFATRLRELANDAENIAIAVAGQAEKNEAETAKMRQLQALLKSLG